VAKGLAASTHVDELRQALGRLEQVAQKIGEAMYAQASGGQDE
jgi:hypothetical protein